MPAHRFSASARTMVIAATIFTVAVFLAPFSLASVWPAGGYADLPALRAALTTGFVHFWATSSQAGGLGDAVEFWGRFHAIKALLAAGMLICLLALLPWTWRLRVEAQGLSRRLLAALLAIMHACAALVALLVLVANVQGMFAPLSSALGLLPIGSADPALSSSIDEVGTTIEAGQMPIALERLENDFVIYHVSMAVLAALTAAAFTVATVRLLAARRLVAARERRQRRMLATASLACAALAAVFGVLVAANISTAADPAPALLNFFAGGM